MSDKTTTAYWHGGVPGLKPGDILQPGHNRKLRDGCPYCEARARVEAHQGIDGPSQLRRPARPAGRRVGRGQAL